MPAKYYKMKPKQEKKQYFQHTSYMVAHLRVWRVHKLTPSVY